MATKTTNDSPETNIVVQSELDLERKVKDFSELLDQIENINTKKKQLWREIYENAVTDRYNAFEQFKALHNIVKSKPMEHAVHDKSIATYLERMAKCNDQLIKLAELLSDAEKRSEAIDPDDMYTQIAGGG